VSWLAEILRKQHRACGRCGLGPTHTYDPVATPAETEPEGSPLCNSCLQRRLAEDFSAFSGRCLVFEPALGPDAYLFHPLTGPQAAGRPAAHRDAARACLDRITGSCQSCGRGAARFAWVPVPADANLWADDWLADLGTGTLAPDSSLCGECAAGRLAASMDERGLCYEAIVPPRGGDGALFADESY